jgi:hypothetical protein
VEAADFNARLFHGPLFRDITAILAADDESIVVEAVAPPADGWFAEADGTRTLLPIALLDVVSQVVGAWLVHRGARQFGVFPYEWERLEQFAAPPAPGTTTRIAARLRLSAGVAMADVEVLLPDGSVLCRATGLRGRVFEMPEPFHSYVFHHTSASRLSEGTGGSRMLVAPGAVLTEGQRIWLRVLARMTLTAREAREWDALGDSESTGWLLDRIAAKELALDMLAAEGLAVPPRSLESDRDGSSIAIAGCGAAAHFTARVSVAARGGRHVASHSPEPHAAVHGASTGAPLS